MKYFKDVKTGDIIYCVIDYERTHENNNHDNIISQFKELGTVETKNDKTEGFDIFELEVENTQYPSIYKTSVNYMKMSGDRPYGVGTSYVDNEDKYNITITLKDNTIFKTKIKVPIDQTYYEFRKGYTYHTTKKDAINYLKKLTNFYIKKYHDMSVQYKQKVLGLKEYKKYIISTL